MITVPAGPITVAGPAIERVIVGVDDSPGGLAALAAATKLARDHRAELVAVRAWALGLPRHGGRRMRHLSHPHVVLNFSGIEQNAASSVLVRRAFGAVAGGIPQDMRIGIETPEGDPAIALIALATRPGDVIVVGTRSGHPAQRLIHGSVSRYCSRHANCPVLVVPARSAAARSA
jgi:nucleotide-binding universal stress UspA family protein